jgi:DNA-binding PadR family transcriptional regulator
MCPRRAAPLTLEFILLGLVSEKPAHGYEIHQELQHLVPFAQVWNIRQPQLYALLDKLESQGLMAGELLPGEGRPDRKQLHITPSGRQRFETWRSTPAAHAYEMRQEFLAKLYFSRRSGKACTLIECQRETCQSWLDSLNRQFNALNADQVDEQLLFNFRILQVKALLEWLDQAAEQICHEQSPA